MKQLILTRSRQFSMALAPYWVVTSMSRAAFLQATGLTGEPDPTPEDEEPPEPPGPPFDAGQYGLPIPNGGRLELALNDAEARVFAITREGWVSNEITLAPGAGVWRIRITTTGGWKAPSRPQLALEQCEG